jgi:ubiquinone/menaquinone biosynthesis C-methylase UbiE
MTDDRTARVRDAWDSLAGGWHDQRAYMLAITRPVHDWMIEALAPREGDTVLEIASGPGDTGFLAAPRLGATGRLLCTDLAPAMVETARKRGAELGVTNAGYRTLDAQAMDLADASVDGVLCRWGFMLMPEPEAAFREVHRVLRPGGRLSCTVFASPTDNPWVALPVQVMVGQGHVPAPPPGAPGILALADRSRLEALASAAGFGATRIEPIAFAWRFPSFDAYWDWLVDITALGPTLRGLGADAQQAVRDGLIPRVAPFREGEGLALPARCWGAVAQR